MKKTINFGVLTYSNPSDRWASSNIGDYVQSLAALNIYRKIVEEVSNVTYHMDDFVKLSLSNRVPGFNFIFIKRDNMSDLSQYHGHNNIITIMNGWWMHPYTDNLDIDFSIPSNITPIFVSFHMANKDILVTSQFSELNKFGRIGCRDLKTTEKFKSRGLDAYFTGCLTTTIDFYTWQQENEISYAVDTVPSKTDIFFSQMGFQWKNIPYKSGFLSALNVLQQYKKCKNVKTSRLHCFLPCLAMGVPVKFISPDGNESIKEWNSKDRFDGLRELQDSPSSFQSLRDSLTHTCINSIKKLI